MKAPIVRRTRGIPSGPAASRKIIIEFPAALFAATERATAELSTSRSALIRAAVADYLARLRKEKFDAELAEGYRANALQARRVTGEMEHAGTEWE